MFSTKVCDVLLQSLYLRLLKLFHLDKILRCSGGGDYEKLCSGCLYRLMLGRPSLEAVFQTDMQKSK